ncbi:PE family protein [Colletotrichum higginsianum]|nr:PE family protein [Colletotrichum higginsianum]
MIGDLERRVANAADGRQLDVQLRGADGGRDDQLRVRRAAGGPRARDREGPVRRDGDQEVVVRGGQVDAVECDTGDQDGRVAHAAGDAEVRHREGLAVAPLERDVAAVDGQQGGVETCGGHGGELNLGAAAGRDGEGAGVEGDLGPGVGGRGRRAGDDELRRAGGEGVDGNGPGVAERVSDVLGGRVLHGEGVLGDEVVGVVEGDAGRGEDRRRVRRVPGLHQTGALLGHGGEEVVADGGAVVPGLGLCRGGDDGAQRLLVEGAADLADEGVDGGHEGRGHGGARVHHVLPLVPGPGREDAAAGGRELRLDVELPGRAVAAEGARVAGGQAVADGLGEQGGGLRGAHGDGDVVGMGDPVLGLTGHNHADALDALGVDRNTVNQVDILGKGLASSVVDASDPQPQRHVGLHGGIAVHPAESKLVRLVDEGAAGHQGWQDGVFDRPDAGNGLPGRRRSNSPDAQATRVPGRHDDGDAGLGDAGHGDTGGVAGPPGIIAGRARDDVAAVLVGAVEGRDQDLARRVARAAADLVGAELDVGRGAREAELVLLRHDDAGDVRAVSLAQVERVGVRRRRLRALEVVVAGEVPAVGDAAALAEAPAERRVAVVHARVDDADADALACESGLAEPVDLRHDVRAVRVLGGGVAAVFDGPKERVSGGGGGGGGGGGCSVAADGAGLGPGHLDLADGPDGLDIRVSGDLAGGDLGLPIIVVVVNAE